MFWQEKKREITLCCVPMSAVASRGVVGVRHTQGECFGLWHMYWGKYLVNWKLHQLVFLSVMPVNWNWSVSGNWQRVPNPGNPWNGFECWAGQGLEAGGSIRYLGSLIPPHAVLKFVWLQLCYKEVLDLRFVLSTCYFLCVYFASSKRSCKNVWQLPSKIK